MFLIRKPTALAIDHFRQSQAGLDFTYSAVGATRDTPPSGFVVDHTRGQIGVGETDFRRAQEAFLARFRMIRKCAVGIAKTWPGCLLLYDVDDPAGVE